jgi:hypothetical protein
MTFPNPHIGQSRHGLFFTRLNFQSNAKPYEKNHDLPGIQSSVYFIYSKRFLHTRKINK